MATRRSARLAAKPPPLEKEIQEVGIGVPIAKVKQAKAKRRAPAPAPGDQEAKHAARRKKKAKSAKAKTKAPAARKAPESPTLSLIHPETLARLSACKSKKLPMPKNPLATSSDFWAAGTEPQFSTKAVDEEVLEPARCDGSRMTVTRAKNTYSFSEDDLYDLDCRYVRNPHYRSAAPMRLYLISELEDAFARHNHQARRNRIIFQKKRLKNRVEILRDKYDIRQSVVAPVFRSYVFRDHLDASVLAPERKIRMLKRLFKAAVRTQTFLAEPLWKTSMVRHMSKVKDDQLLRRFPKNILAQVVSALDQSAVSERVLGTTMVTICKFLDGNDRHAIAEVFPTYFAQRGH